MKPIGSKLKSVPSPQDMQTSLSVVFMIFQTDLFIEEPVQISWHRTTKIIQICLCNVGEGPKRKLWSSALMVVSHETHNIIQFADLAFLCSLLTLAFPTTKPFLIGFSVRQHGNGYTNKPQRHEQTTKPPSGQ
jgi:hypothetical protein